MGILLYNRSIIPDRNGGVVGINLGDNLYGNIETCIPLLQSGLNSYAKATRKSLKKADRWRNTPFCSDMILSNVPYFNKTITINNTSLSGRTLLSNGDYNLLVIGSAVASMNKRKKVYSEAELWDTREYQVNGAFNRSTLGDISIQGYCSPNLDYIIILEKIGGSVIESLVLSLESGNLCMCGSIKVRQLFKYCGLCLVDLEKAYLTGRRV